MWWLTIPVIIYSAGIFVLWLILRRCSGKAVPDGDGSIRVMAGGSSRRVTVVVAARNEEKRITALLESLTAQDYPRDLLEVIIVNDNSTDRTPIIVSEFIRREGAALNIRLIYSLMNGKKNASRQGGLKAAGELIITTDADCTVGPGWVSAHAAAYEPLGGHTHAEAYEPSAGNAEAVTYEPMGKRTQVAVCEAGSADMLVGEVYQGPARGFVSLFGMLEFSALQAISESAVVAGRPVMCSAANMSFRRETYLRQAGELRPDIPSGDDMFLLHAVIRAGGVIRYAGSSAAAVETASAVTAAALLRQRARWASKSFHYSNAATLTLAAATAACNTAVTAAAAAAVISPGHIPLLATLYGIKVLPDYLIIAHNIKKRDGKMPLITFLLSELIYPFYFMTVAIISLFPSSRRFAQR